MTTKKKAAKKATRKAPAKKKAPARKKKATTSKPKAAKKKIGRPRLTAKELKEKRAANTKVKADERERLQRIAAEAKANARKTTKEAALSPSPKRRGRGKPPFEPKEEQRAQVETLSGLGLRFEEIAILIDNPDTGRPIDVDTLKRHFRLELERGIPKANSMVAQSLYKRAIDPLGGSGSVTAGIFFAKCRMGWKETTVVQVEDKSGVLVAPAAASPQEWIQQAKARTDDAKDPGTIED